MARRAVALRLLAATLCAASIAAAADDCENVVFDHVDSFLKLRTMVVEDHSMQRSLISMSAEDTSMPCKLDWWLQHNPQGIIKCVGSSPHASTGGACKASDCQADVDDIMNGYVRTMLSGALLAPQSHELSAICIEMGCRARVKRTRMPSGNLLQTAPEAPWVPRRQPKAILVIGLGSSTMALWFRKHVPEAELHVAELVPSVVDSAPCFGLNTTDPRLHLHTGDGRAFLKSSADGAYDAILIDAFDPDASLPPCFRTAEFFALAKQKLSAGGAVTFNLLSDKTSMGVLKAMADNFPADRIWIGDAPGAEGIQYVVAAFGKGRASDPGDAKVEPGARATAWFDQAGFRRYEPSMVKDATSFADATECTGGA